MPAEGFLRVGEPEPQPDASEALEDRKGITSKP